ncbi:reverse transcriptase, partial [Phytophthora megakarya]
MIVYASDWAISASLMQAHDEIYHPVVFASRTLKVNELSYNVSEKEVLALLRIWDLYYNLLVGREIRVLTRHSMPAVQVGAITRSFRIMVHPPGPVDSRDHEMHERRRRDTGGDRCQHHTEVKDRRHLNRYRPQGTQTPDSNDDTHPGWGGAFSAIVWSLPGWKVVKAKSCYLENLTVNDAEYNGLLLGLDMLADLDRKRLVRGEIDCKSPGLTLWRQKALDRLREWSDHELVHVKRDWNGSVDSLASAVLQRQGGIEVHSGTEHQDLVTLNRLDEILVHMTENPMDLIREMRVDRIRQAQDEEVWITGMKKYLSGSFADFTQAEARSYGKITADYEVDKQDLLVYCPPTPRSGDDRDRLLRLVVPETLQSDVLHHYHTTLEGGHQRIGRTYQRIRNHVHWRGLYRSVQRYVGEFVDCKTGKGRPVIQGESPGNLQATYPFQIIAMDHIPSLPRSNKGNTELLIWVDLFTGYVVAKASSSRTAQTVAESYEECVFRGFRASEIIRHDREPGVMSDFFRSFNKILGQRQRATMVYRPQANGIAERMVQPATGALKMYVHDLDQKDWGEYAERLMFAINTLTIEFEETHLNIRCTGGI